MIRGSIRRAATVAGVAVSLWCATASVAFAADDAQRAEMKAALAAGMAVAKAGPTDVALRDQATLKLPADDLFVPMPEAGRLLRALGNRTDDRLVGLVFPKGGGDWLTVIRYEASGFVNDDEAKNWDVDKLFKALKEGTEAANADRRQRGFSEIDVVGWVEKPRYDAANHRLVWSMAARDRNAPANASQVVNYNTYALGREGYFTLNLISDRKTIDADKPAAQALLAGLGYRDGKGYGDFNKSTDRVAEYGIAALVAGVAAKKLGLIAVIAALAAKSIKLVAIAGLALLAGLAKLFGRRKDDPVA